MVQISRLACRNPAPRRRRDWHNTRFSRSDILLDDEQLVKPGEMQVLEMARIRTEMSGWRCGSQMVLYSNTREKRVWENETSAGINPSLHICSKRCDVIYLFLEGNFGE
jgi:hypothetical protein